MQAFTGFIKSGLNAAFFCLLYVIASITTNPVFGVELSEASTSDQLYELARGRKLDKQPVWSALLHVENGKANIRDEGFLLSLPNFSLINELQQTIYFLYRGEPAHVCRFPARYLWLRQHLDAPELPLDKCPDIIEYREKVPLDEITLVFASERISQPASMLGHAFLKFSGKNENGIDVSHAISFYTDVNTINLPKLLFDSLVVGKQGYFNLSPYYEKQQRYVDEEQRNIWEYTLALDKSQRELLRMHIYELKQSNLTYFFQNYNCATVLNFVISLSGKPMPENGWWITPKDLIKNAQQAGLIGETRVVTPSRWLYRALAEQVTSDEQQAIRLQVEQGKVADSVDSSGSEKAFIRFELASAYNQYAYLNGDIDKGIWKKNDNSVADNRAKYFFDKALSSGKWNNPLDSPGDSQIFVTARNDNHEDSLELSVLPVSHTLGDDNRSYASETSLQMFATTIRMGAQYHQPELDRLVVFDMLSLIPHDSVTGGRSVHIHIAVEQQLNKILEEHRVFATSGAIGITKRLANDMDIFTLLGGGVGYTGERGYLYPEWQTGAIVREVWDMKSIFTFTRTDNQYEMGTHFYTVSFVQSKFFDKSKTLQVSWRRDINDISERNMIALTMKYIF